MKDLVSVQWLLDNQNLEHLIVLDASLPSVESRDSDEHANLTIPNARFFDLKGKFSDKTSAFPNTVPSKDQFEKECRSLGINNASKIVVFDNRGIYSSPRAWWLFKLMSHEHVAVLDGGLPEWIRLGNETVERSEETYTEGDFVAQESKDWIKSYEDVLENLKTEEFQVVDARSRGRFEGVEPEPRKQLKSGSIKGAINIPYKELLDGTKFKSIGELRAIFEAKVQDDRDMVYSCGSGITACIVMLASEVAYKSGKLLFDGSWTEWAERQGLVYPT